VVWATVILEARSAALMEAADLIIPIRRGTITSGHLAGNLADLVAGVVHRGSDPRSFKDPRSFQSVGMAWEDLVVATAARPSRAGGPPGG
jgi:ornithine cyclodeaminase/alanine dehydrogenase-like protein (mu-crystallin family)